MVKLKLPRHLHRNHPRSRELFNYRKLWLSRLFILTCVAAGPFLLLALFNQTVGRISAERDVKLRLARLVSNHEINISDFLDQRRTVLDYIIRDNPADNLADSTRLGVILDNLNSSMGGFTDLGLINKNGRQVAYAGPHELLNTNYKEADWFKKFKSRDNFVSDVFMGFRDMPHIIIGVRHQLNNRDYHFLKATIDTRQFNNLLTPTLDIDRGDAFLINHTGVLQTPSRSHGSTLEQVKLVPPEKNDKATVEVQVDGAGKKTFVGYAYLIDTPFILMITEPVASAMDPWRRDRNQITIFIVLGLILILAVVYRTASRMIDEIFAADQHRLQSLDKVNENQKLASIGRLAAGVAHEVNNPLAVINEKAGLLKDIVTSNNQYKNDTKLVSIANSIIASVERGGKITKRLLSFARHMKVEEHPMQVEEVIRDVLGFLKKEAEYRSIEITLETYGEIPSFFGDRGKVQQVFLNLINNAFDAMEKNGHLAIGILATDDNRVAVAIRDTGCGIREKDIPYIFEPFFSTKTASGGTGLGLSITFGIIQELGGTIEVDSIKEKGTSFTVYLPTSGSKENSSNENSTR
ncbi:MAG: ATP-binding protein [Thermodesulfobacteriota bacterium]